jgi:hypothetical protein
MSYPFFSAASGGACGDGNQVATFGPGVKFTNSSWTTRVQSGAAAHSATLTTTSSSSLVVAATVNGAAAFTAANGSAYVVSNIDSTIGSSYSIQVMPSTASGTNITLGDTSTSPGGLAMVELPGVTAITVANAASYITTGINETASVAWWLPDINNSVWIVGMSAMGNPFGAGVNMTLVDAYGGNWTPLAEASTPGNHYAGVWLGVGPGNNSAFMPSTVTLAPATVGYPYSYQIPPTGMQWLPYSATPVTVAPGLAVGSNAVVSGVPTATGTHAFNVSLSDQQGITSTVNCSLTINAAPIT